MNNKMHQKIPIQIPSKLYGLEPYKNMDSNHILKQTIYSIPKYLPYKNYHINITNISYNMLYKYNTYYMNITNTKYQKTNL